MTSQSVQTCTRMFDICYNLRNNFPSPISCKDEQLYEFWYEMKYKWSVNNQYIKSGKAQKYDDENCEDDNNKHMLKNWEETLIEQCCYYENMIDEIEYEINRRPWLKDKPFPPYEGGRRCIK